MNGWPYPRLFAHRGGGTLAPENTLSAIRLGQTLGYAAHEFDVKLSRDGVAMLLHDATLERTTSGKGAAAELDWKALRTLDAGAWHSLEYRGEPIPSLEEAAWLLRSRGTLANVEIKPSPGRERETGERVAAETWRLWEDAAVPPLLSSFSFEALMAAKAAAPGLARGWLKKQFEASDWDLMAELEAASLHTDHRTFDVALVPRLHEAGYRVLLYTVNDVAAAQRFLEAGVDGLFTDNLRVFADRFPDFTKA